MGCVRRVRETALCAFVAALVVAHGAAADVDPTSCVGAGLVAIVALVIRELSAPMTPVDFSLFRDVTFTSGAEALKPLADGALRSAVFPELSRKESPARLALRVHVMCSHGNCRAGVDFPKNARTEVPLPH